MITLENHIGRINLSNRYISDLIRNTVAGCFGVADMNAISVADDICSFFRKGSICRTGVSIKVRDNKPIINIHISVLFGTNISAVVSSLKHKVRFAVKEATGIDTAAINVSVDGIVDGMAD